MNKTDEKPRIGRPTIPDEDKLVVGGLRLTKQQWKDFNALGGVVWLREAIKRATARRK